MNRTLRTIYHRLPLGWRPPRGARECLAFNQRFQHWPVGQMRDYQTRKLRDLLVHAGQNVPYYAGLFRKLRFRPEEIQSLDEIGCLPLLEKQVVRENPKALTAVNWKEWQTHTHFTGGTSGQKLAVSMARRTYYAHLADQLRQYEWAGYRPGQRLVTISHNLHGFEEVEGIAHLHRPRNTLFVNGKRFNQETLARMAEAVVRFRPQAFYAAPSHLYLLYQYLKEHGIEGVRPHAIVTSSEMLYDFQRHAIESFFGARVFDFYGQAEHVANASQCEAGRYHMSLEYTYVEVLRPDGTPAGPGEVGEIVGTNLDNYPMPLVRYRTGDLGVLADGPCPCGRTLPALQSVSGRSQDVVVTPSGLAVFHGVRFSFHDIRSIQEIQIVQEEVSRFCVKAVVTPDYRPEDGRRLAAALEKGLGYPLDVSVEPVTSIPRTESGKLRLLICNVPSGMWTGRRETAQAA